MAVVVDIVGLGEFLRALDDFPQIFNEEMKESSDQALGYLKSPLEEYPPERSGQTYVRTFLLREGWITSSIDYQVVSSGFIATATNSTPYGPYVQGDPSSYPHQAWMHQDRWSTTQAIVDDNELALIDRFSEGLDRVVVRLGGK